MNFCRLCQLDLHPPVRIFARNPTVRVSEFAVVNLFELVKRMYKISVGCCLCTSAGESDILIFRIKHLDLIDARWRSVRLFDREPDDFCQDGFKRLDVLLEVHRWFGIRVDRCLVGLQFGEQFIHALFKHRNFFFGQNGERKCPFSMLHACKNGLHRIIVSLSDWIEFMIVTSGAP